jgi:hypothetical protein
MDRLALEGASHSSWLFIQEYDGAMLSNQACEIFPHYSHLPTQVPSQGAVSAIYLIRNLRAHV